MADRTAAVTSRVSTRSVAPADRESLWEDYNSRALVGLTCSSYAEEGLLATQVNVRFAELRMADIAGNEHVIERPPATCRALPKDSVFASLLLAGDGVFYHRDGSVRVAPGDLLLYDTRRPYLFGFSSSMRQLLVDIPRELFTEHCPGAAVSTPTRFGRGAAREAGNTATLRSLLLGLVREPHTTDAVAARDTVLGLLRLLTAERLTGADDPAAGSASTRAARSALAKRYIDHHLHDPRLDAGRVAGALGVSVRHLSRIFTAEGITPARYILTRRLESARAQLVDPASPTPNIADVAHRWGFSSQSHFTRVFREHFGTTPGHTRRPAGAAPARDAS
ncbi:AraC family transcriptional regulator [Embleya scabrispora]|uniref:AraC family transcriptional regulator n=1 Tax=Embleya scabrispora TaxID=159449 RepID=A0A1T3NKX7_9ACTN|nr:helix-turn-helix domain-containing protein [Embleya scabrispora]OPC77368.1 AraC family transcriptional regulator [Embleya scabrispora]